VYSFDSGEIKWCIILAVEPGLWRQIPGGFIVHYLHGGEYPGSAVPDAAVG
jgi:hypothetical protein